MATADRGQDDEERRKEIGGRKPHPGRVWDRIEGRKRIAEGAHSQEDLVRKVWNYIEDLRRQWGYSVTGVNGIDKKIDVSPSYYYKWKYGLPPPKYLLRIERVYGLSRGELIDLAERSAPLPPKRPGDPILDGITVNPVLTQEQKRDLIQLYVGFLTEQAQGQPPSPEPSPDEDTT